LLSPTKDLQKHQINIVISN